MAGRPDSALAPGASEWRADRIKPSLADVLKKLPDYEPLPRAPTTGWEETVVLAAAMAADAPTTLRAPADGGQPAAGRAVRRRARCACRRRR